MADLSTPKLGDGATGAGLVPQQLLDGYGSAAAVVDVDGRLQQWNVHFAESLTKQGLETAYGLVLPLDGEGRVMIGNDLKLAAEPLRDSEGTIQAFVLNDPSNGAAEASARPLEADPQALLEQLLDSMSDPIFFKDLQGRYRRVNQAFLDLFGLDRSEIIGATEEVFCDSVLAAKVRNDDAEVIRVARPKRFLYRLPMRHIRRAFETLKAPLFALDGECVGIVGLSRDVTSEVLQTAELQRSRERLGMVVAAAELGVIEAEREDEGWHYRWDELVFKILGLAQTERPGVKAFLDRVLPEDRDPLIYQYNQCLRTRREFRIVFRIEHPELGLRRAELRGRVLFDGDRPWRMVATIADVTDRQLLRSQLEASHERMLLAMQAARIGTWEWNLREEALFLSEQAMELLNVSGSEQSTDISDFVAAFSETDQTVVEGAIRRCRDELAEIDVVAAISAISPERVVRIVGTVVTNEHDQPSSVVGVLADVTADFQSRKRLEAARDQAVAATAAKSRFLASMSHEIRTPLNAIFGFAQLLRDEDFVSEEQGEHVAAILRAVDQLTALVDDVLDISKIEAGVVDLSHEVLHLRSFLLDIARTFKLQLRSSPVALFCELGNAVDAHFEFDASKVRQVLTNVLANAVNYTESGKIVLYGDIAGAPEAPRVRLKVCDTGVGISEDVIEHIFDEYHRGESQRDGTGLGLAISKRIIDALGGNITLRSELGTGTEVEIEVPVLRSNAPPKQSKRARVQLPDRLHKRRILVVDDQLDNRRALRRMLEKAGAEVLEADHGAQALSMLEQEKWHVDAILTDLQMPIMDGRGLMSRVRSLRLDPPPLIAISANVMKEEGSDPAAGLADAFLSKPFGMEDLLTTVESRLKE